MIEALLSLFGLTSTHWPAADCFGFDRDGQLWLQPLGSIGEFTKHRCRACGKELNAHDPLAGGRGLVVRYEGKSAR